MKTKTISFNDNWTSVNPKTKNIKHNLNLAKREMKLP